MGLFGTIAGVVEGIAGLVADIAGLFSNFEGHSGYGESLDGHSGYGSSAKFIPGATWVGVPDPNVVSLDDKTVNMDDVAKSDLVTPSMIGMDKNAVLTSGAFQTVVETYATAMPMTSMQKGTQDITFTRDYTFTGKPTDLESKTININFEDHVYFHLIPRRFKWYNKLLEHEYVKMHYVDVTVTQLSTDKNATILGFIPTSKDTRKIPNEDLLMLSHKVTYQEGKSFNYRLIYVSPHEISYEMDKNGDYTSIKPVNAWVNPNYIMRTDYLRGMPHRKITGSDTLVEGGNEMSYGTLILMKRNPDQQEISVSVTMTMHFEYWDPFKTKLSINQTLLANGIADGDGIKDGSEGEEGESGDTEDGDGQDPDGDGAMPPQGATKRPVISGRRRKI